MEERPRVNKYIVGIYAASANLGTDWNPSLEDELFTLTSKNPSVSGLELPINENQQLHKHDPKWLAKKIQECNSNWNIVFTLIPATMEILTRDPHFGLASNNAEGRKKAVELLKRTRDLIVELNTILNRKAVIGIQIHSAPKLGGNGVSSSKESFTESLKEIRGWDWQNAFIAVEHCDQYHPSQVGSKQFLSLEDELWAIEHSADKSKSQPITGITINWARSAIEGRSASTPVIHIERVKKSSVPLLGLMFSGAISETDDVYGAPWLDIHVPFGKPISSNATHSLMDKERVKESLEASDWKHLTYLGVKIAPKPANLSISERITFINDGCKLLDELIKV